MNTTQTETFENTTAVGSIKSRRRDTDSAFERETIIVMSDAEDVVYITTAQRTMVTKLLRHPSFTLTDDTGGKDGTARQIMGTLPMQSLISIRAGKRGSGAKVAPAQTDKPKRTMNAARCTHIKDDGSKCNMVAMKGLGKCRWHK